MIAESHISFHTFPAPGFVAIDLYTCRTDLDRDAAIARLSAAFGIAEADIHVQDRAIRYPDRDILAGLPGARAESALPPKGAAP